ncbi:hypothetical protein [Prevotellamassilia timonensis]|uniref:hypothetical protein n=1 Tax=Prevotellamassilia timonensis TaxID=1852370 RepID=UPI0023EF8693|nr:hypothetical protein [Prevotellamassilia timonensis]MDD7439754.1 hypothetical protein [Prevotellamassilia timonensis]
MTKKELKVINTAIHGAMDVLETLSRKPGDWTYYGIADEDLRNMFYDLNTMCLKLNERICNMDGE